MHKSPLDLPSNKSPLGFNIMRIDNRDDSRFGMLAGRPRMAITIFIVHTTSTSSTDVVALITVSRPRRYIRNTCLTLDKPLEWPSCEIRRPLQGRCLEPPKAPCNCNLSPGDVCSGPCSRMSYTRAQVENSSIQYYTGI